MDIEWKSLHAGWICWLFSSIKCRHRSLTSSNSNFIHCVYSTANTWKFHSNWIHGFIENFSQCGPKISAKKWVVVPTTCCPVYLYENVTHINSSTKQLKIFCRKWNFDVNGRIRKLLFGVMLFPYYFKCFFNPLLRFQRVWNLKI